MSERLNTAERALVLRMLRDAREMLAARLEQARLEEELTILSSAIRKIWMDLL